MRHIRLTHIDGKLPNLALMKLAHWHKAQGDAVVQCRTPTPALWEPAYDVVYASSIFSGSARVLALHRAAWPDSIIGGTGSDNIRTVETVIGQHSYEHYDYSIYPDYPFSLGFTQRGCRLNCAFCVVPHREGKPRSVNTIWDIWRPGTARRVVLLDNDFFGQEEAEWQARLHEIRTGDFKVSFNQGINIRLITPEAATAIAGVQYFDDQFKTRRLYTAWDSLGQERIFFQKLGVLEEAGVPSRHIMVYMLIGYAPGETMSQILYRYRKIKEAGCTPYPMVYNNANPTLKRFARWVIRRYDEFIPWDEFARGHYHKPAPGARLEAVPLPLGLT